MLGQGKGDGCRDAPSAREAGDVGARRVDAVVAAQLVQDIQGNPDAPPWRDIVARAARGGEQDALRLAQLLECLPPRRLVRRRQEQDRWWCALAPWRDK